MIMDALLKFFGADPVQWRALLRASYLLLKRNPASIKGLGTGRSSRAGGILVMLVFYSILGLVFAFVRLGNAAPSIAASVVLIPTSFFIASIILLEFGATIISPEDFAVLSVQPISSRTYFAARVSVIILLTLLFAAALNLPSAIVFMYRKGLLEGLVWVIAASANALATGMGMVLLYAFALRVIPYRRLMTLMAYLQMSISFAIYGGFGLLSSRISEFTGGMVSSLPWWWYLLPPVWFSSFTALAAGDWTPGNLILAFCGIVLLGVLLPAGMSKISLSYAESISRAATLESVKKHPVRLRRVVSLLKRSEDRAIATLIARQFRYDIKFKMTVLGIVPLTALYVYQGLSGGGGFYDPFRHAMDMRGMIGSSVLYIAIILFPGILKDEIGRSDNFQAAWVFFSTPADRATLVLAVKRVLTVYFLIPYLFLLSFVFYYFFRDVLHVLMHEVVILLASQLLLQLAFLISPRLPFSTPRGVGERIGLTTFIVLLGPILLLAMLAFFSRYFYINAVSYVVGTSALGILVVIMERLLRHRVSRKVGGLEFAG
jgi:ABC-2 type transport system permease protein